jgi:adenylate kinase family enzyme
LKPRVFTSMRYTRGVPDPRVTTSAVSPRLERGVFLLSGVSGSGKGSVGEGLLKMGSIGAHASMGQWLRDAIEHPGTLETRLTSEQPQGLSKLEYLRHCVTHGLLIPDAWTQAVIEWQLERVASGRWVLDGYPRTVGAARHLLEALEARGIALLGAVELQIPLEVMRRRLLARGREDDTEAALRRRLDFYRESVIPTLEWLEARHVRVHRVDASASLERVVQDVKNRLEGESRDGSCRDDFKL